MSLLESTFLPLSLHPPLHIRHPFSLLPVVLMVVVVVEPQQFQGLF